MLGRAQLGNDMQGQCLRNMIYVVLTWLLLCRTLQSLLAVVPQKPVILQGSIADNLDPQGLHPPQALMAVLRDVRLLAALRPHALDHFGRSGADRTFEMGAAPALPVANAISQGVTGSVSLRDDDARVPLLPSTSTSSGAGEMLGEYLFELLQLKLGDGGIMLSLGQQQLLSVARALLRKPAVVCLDEVSAHLSMAESSMIESVVSERLRNITCVRISHDVNTLMACNTVGVLECGKLVELGRPSELTSVLLRIHNVRNNDLDKMPGEL